MTGLDDGVYNFVFNLPESNVMYDKIHDLISYLIPLYIKEGKTRLVVAFGCTGGKHRSVSFARRLAKQLHSEGFDARAEHRCVER